MHRERSIIWALRATQHLPEAGDFQGLQSFSPQSRKDNWMPDIRAQRQRRASRQNAALSLSTVQCTVPRASLTQVTAIMRAGCWQGLCSPGLSRAPHLNSAFQTTNQPTQVMKSFAGNKMYFRMQESILIFRKKKVAESSICNQWRCDSNFSLCSKCFSFPIPQLTAINWIYFPSC